MRQDGRSFIVKRNIFFGVIQVFASQFLPFFIRTILIWRFGVEYLGLNSFFTSVLGMLSLVALGFETAIVYSLFKPVSENNIEQICAYLTYYRRACRFIGMLILTVGLIIAPVLKCMIKDTVLPGNLSFYVCYFIFLGDSVISYLLYGYLCVIPMAFQRIDIMSKINIGMSLLKFLLQSLILLFFHDYYLFLISIPIITVVYNLLIAYVVKGKYPSIKCGKSIDKEQKHDLNRRIYGVLISKLTGVSRSSIDSLCISSFIGLAVAGLYNNYYYIFAAVLAFGSVISNSMLASVGNSILTENRDKNYNDMRLFDFMHMILSGWAVVCMLCLYQPFIITWLGEEMLLDISVVIGLCFYFYILRMGSLRWVYQEGAGLWYESRFIMIGEAAVNIVLNIVFCSIWGVTGIVLATVISVFITNAILCPRLVFRLYFKNGKMKEYLKDHAKYLGTMMISASVSWFLCETVLSVNMVSGRKLGMCLICLCGRLVICTLVFVILTWIVWNRSQRYKNALTWLKSNYFG